MSDVVENKRIRRWVFQTLNIGAMCRDFRHGASQYHITSCCYHYFRQPCFRGQTGSGALLWLMHYLKMVKILPDRDCMNQG